MPTTWPSSGPAGELKDLAAYLEEIDNVIQERNLKQMNDSGALEKIIDEVIAANADNVAQFRAGRRIKGFGCVSRGD